MSGLFTAHKIKSKNTFLFSLFFILYFVFLFQINTANAVTPWYNLSWGYRTKITIDHSKVASSTGTLNTNFPILVSTTSVALKYTAFTGGHVASTTGKDILFTSYDGITKLNHEIESYSSSTGNLISWVKIPLLATSTDTDIYMYYGNASATDQSTTTGVWDDGGNNYYKGVWHLADTESTTTDSTLNAKNGTQVGGATFGASGKIGRAISFDGTNDYINIGNVGDIKTISYWTDTSSNNFLATPYIGDTFYKDGEIFTPLGSEIINNGTFNSNLTGWTAIYGPAFQWMNEVSGDGSTGYLRFPLDTGVDWDRFVYNSNIITSNTYYRVSFWYRTSANVTGNMFVYFTDNQDLMNNNTLYNIPPSTTWKYLSFVMKSSSLSFPKFGIAKGGNIGEGNFDVDAISVKVITPSLTSGQHHISLISSTGFYSSLMRLGIANAFINTILDEARVSSVARSADWIKTEYNNQSSPSTFYLMASEEAVTVPDAPTNLTLTPSNTQVDLSWTAPINTGGVSLTDYVIDYKTTSTSTWSTFADGVSTTTNFTITGLTNGTSYDFRVSAVNSVGQGTSSAIVSATPATIPDAPIIGTATAGNAQATVPFSAPINNGGSTITNYTVTSNPGNFTASSSTSPITVTGLTNGTPYTFTVTATNVMGTGPASSASNSVTPVTVPNAPTAVSVTPSNTQVSLTWSSPGYNGGSSITDYVIEYKPSSEPTTWSIFSDGVSIATSSTLTNLTNGTSYDFRISAVNSAGQGTASSPSSATPATIPDAPIIGTATAGNASAFVAFTPLSNPTVASWYNNAWTYRKKITIDKTKVPNTDQTNFPVLISLSGLSNINASGTDIRFTSSDGTTELAREIESYSNGTLIAWVKIPTLSSSVNTEIFMYYGNSLATEPASNSTYGSQNVWDSNFKGVWHLPNGTTLSVNDSTSNANNGTNNGATATTGKVDGGGGFDGSTQYVGIIPSDSVRFNSNKILMSAWVYPTAFQADTDFSTILVKSHSYYFQINPSGYLAFYAYGVTSSYLLSSSTISLNIWQYVQVVYDGSLVKFYINGILSGTHNASGNINYNGGDDYLGIGANLNTSGTLFFNNNRRFKGKLDDVRLSSVARSADWIATEYNNQSNPANFYTVATQENINSYTTPATGGSAITSYTVTSNPGNFTASSSTSPITVTGLTNGTPYTFTVTATNVMGTGPASSASNSVTPATVPDAPTNLLTTAGNGQIQLNWSAPAVNGGSVVTDYVIEYKLTSEPIVWSIFSDGVSALTTGAVTGLANGSSYDFRISSVNVMGQGNSSAGVSATPVTVPDAPTSVNAVAGNAQATITFTPPVFNGGLEITSYIITSNPGNVSTTTNGTVGVVTGLTNGTEYTFTVAGINSVGTGVYSEASNVVIPVTTPGSPTSVVATPGNQQASVTFNAPVSDGGTTITSYTITSNPGNISTTTNTTTGVVTGLTNGLSYTFTVRATNAVGTGSVSAPSNSVTLSTEPTMPVNLAVTVSGSRIGLSWSAPVSNGGSAITDYIVEYKLTDNGVWSVFADGVTNGTTATVNGLSNDTSYDFRVSAVNIIGQSTPSDTVTATPGEPAQVIIQNFTDLSVSTIGTAVRITNEGSSEYEYQYTWCVTDSSLNLCGGDNDIFSASAAKLVQAGQNWDTTLLSNVSSPGNYWFHVNVIYGSQSSTAYQSFTAQATYPDAPSSVTASSSNAEALVSFSAPASNGGSAITAYTVTSNPNGITATGASSPITVTGLTNGTTYTFTVTATNAIGIGPASSPSNSVIPATIPNAPTNVSATPGNGQVSLSWIAPINNGGMVINDYVIEYKINSDSIWSVFSDGLSTATNVVVTGLTNDLTYDFRISAVNPIGQSLVNPTSAGVPTNIPTTSSGNRSRSSSGGSSRIIYTTTQSAEENKQRDSTISTSTSIVNLVDKNVFKSGEDTNNVDYTNEEVKQKPIKNDVINDSNIQNQISSTPSDDPIVESDSDINNYIWSKSITILITIVSLALIFGGFYIIFNLSKNEKRRSNFISKLPPLSNKPRRRI